MEMKLDYLMGPFFVFLYINDLVCVSSTLGIIVFLIIYFSSKQKSSNNYFVWPTQK